ncbi:MAG: hypothetical protein AAGH88_09045 [Planctomycetota bacterium]
MNHPPSDKAQQTKTKPHTDHQPFSHDGVRYVYDPLTRRVRPQSPDGRWIDEDYPEEAVVITPEDTKVFGPRT